ncbi:MAG: four-carbon acid sugar kinase family protein, partial [Rubrobacteraceae bacterium]
MRIAVLADDLTGAADTGVQLVRAGYRTAVIFRDEPIPEGFDAVVIDTDTRIKRARQAVKRVYDAARKVRGVEIIYKKLDSTLRGSIAAEISVTLEATHLDRAIVAPAFPGAGRTTVNGVQ